MLLKKVHIVSTERFAVKFFLCFLFFYSENNCQNLCLFKENCPKNYYFQRTNVETLFKTLYPLINDVHTMHLLEMKLNFYQIFGICRDSKLEPFEFDVLCLNTSKSLVLNLEAM